MKCSFSCDVSYLFTAVLMVDLEPANYLLRRGEFDVLFTVALQKIFGAVKFHYSLFIIFHYCKKFSKPLYLLANYHHATFLMVGRGGIVSVRRGYSKVPDQIISKPKSIQLPANRQIGRRRPPPMGGVFVATCGRLSAMKLCCFNF